MNKEQIDNWRKTRKEATQPGASYKTIASSLVGVIPMDTAYKPRGDSSLPVSSLYPFSTENIYHVKTIDEFLEDKKNHKPIPEIDLRTMIPEIDLKLETRTIVGGWVVGAKGNTLLSRYAAKEINPNFYGTIKFDGNEDKNNQ